MRQNPQSEDLGKEEEGRKFQCGKLLGEGDRYVAFEIKKKGAAL